MAEFDEIDSLGSLGPSFGGINRPTPGKEQDFLPYEGDTPRLPEPDIKQSFFGPNVHRDQQVVRNTTVGKDPVYKTGSFAKNLGKNWAATAQTMTDKSSYGQIYSYDAGPTGGAFYDRYAAYGDETFSRIGFSPFRDNEAIFNARTNMWDDWGRMMTHSFWPLFKRGFVSGPKSLGRMMQGDFGSDPEDAEVYERAAAIGQSSKGGVSAFFNNTAMNFGYTAGIIVEAVAEEVGGALLAPLTGGTSFVAASANNLRKLKGLGQAIDLTKAVNESIKAASTVSGARKLWNAAKLDNIAKVTQSSTGRFLNPLENVTEAGINILRNEDNLTGLARTIAGTKQTAGALYRDVRNINMALAEARLEGGFVENTVYDRLYNEYYHDKGFAPDNKTQQEMINQAKDAGMETLGWNTALIYASNKIVLDNIVGPRGGLSKFISSKTKEILETPLKGGKLVGSTKTLKTGKVIQDVKTTFEKSSIKNSLKSIRRQPITKTLKGAGMYFKANVTEGLQENAQEAIAYATEKYYVDSFNDPALATHLYSRGVYLEGLKEQWSAQGAETFASGFFMGMFAGPLNKAIPTLSLGYNKIFNKEEYQKHLETRSKIGDSVANNLTTTFTNVKDFFNPRFLNYAAQNRAAMANSLEEYTKEQAQDMAHAALVRNVHTALQYGTTENIKSYVSSLQELTVEELEEALELDPGQGIEYQSKLGQVLQKIENIEKSYEKYNKMYPNPINLKEFEEGTQEYKNAEILSHAWEEGKYSMLYFNEEFMDTGKRMMDIENIIISNPGLEKISQSDLQVVFEQTRLDNEIGLLENELEVLQSLETVDKTKLRKQETKLAKLKALKDTMAKFTNMAFDLKLTNIIQPEELVGTKDMEDYTLEEIELNLASTQEQKQLQLEEALSKFKDAYTDYVKTLGSQNNALLFDEDIETTFNQLLDYYQLSSDRGNMARLVNVLNNPRNFLDLVERNQKWATSLYENRKEYFRNMVEQAMTANETNALLNALADRDIYISNDDLQAYLEEGTIPTEFFRNQNKEVIREGHPEFAELERLFIALAESKKADVKQKFEGALQEKIDELNQRRQAEIDALDKQPTKVSLGTINPPKGKKLTIQVINDNMEVGDYVEVTFRRSRNADAETSIYYKAEDGLRLNNENGELIDLKTKQRFDVANKYKIEMQPDPAAVKEINDRYDQLEADLIKDYRDKAGQSAARPIQFTAIPYDTPWDQLPREVAEKIMFEAFPQYLDANPIEKEAYDKMTDEQQQEMIESFARTNPLAFAVIDEYNQAQKLKAVQDAGTSIVVPELYDKEGNPINAEELTVPQLRAYVKRVETRVLTLEAMKERSPEQNLELERQQLLKTQIENYIKYRVTQEEFPLLEQMKGQLQKLISMQAFIQRNDATHTYMVNNQLGYTSVTTMLEQSGLYPAYTYADTAKVEKAYQATLGNPKTKGTADEFIEMFKASQPKGFDVPSTFDLLRSKINDNSSLEDIQKAIKSAAYEENRVAGNYIDEQGRLLFSNRTPVFDETKITKEAFESMFGENGYFTKIKNRIDSGELYILAENLKVFDEDLKIAGEIDLLVVDTEGNTFIVDMKTGGKQKWDAFTQGGAIAQNNIMKYYYQTRAYSHLLYNMTGIKVSGLGVLPIEIEFEEGTNKMTKAGAPSNQDILGGGIFKKFGKSKQADQDIAKLIPLKSAEDIENYTGMRVGAVMSPQAKSKLTRLGFTDQMINLMTPEDIEEAKTFTSKDDAKDMLNKYANLVFDRSQNSGEDGTTPVNIAEDMRLKDDARRLAIAEEKARIKNVDIIGKKIEILRKRRESIAADAQSIRDTLGFLNDLLDSTVEGTLNDIEGILAKVENLDQVARLVLKAGQSKRAGKIDLSKKQLQDQIRREFSVAQDVLNRINELQGDLKQLEEIEKDMTSQLSYYQNLVASKDMRSLDRKEIEKKIKKVEKKLNTIQRLINLLRKAIKQSLAYLNEYTKIWNGKYSALEKFKEDTGFKYLSQEELQELIKSTNPTDVEKLDNYANLKSQYERLEAEAIDLIDTVEMLEDAKSAEVTRLERLSKAAVKYQDQIRYLQELLEPVYEDLTSEPLVDVTPEAPAPTATSPGSETVVASMDFRIGELIERKSSEEVLIGSFDLGSIGISLAPASMDITNSGIYADILTSARAIKTIDDYSNVSSDLMFAFSSGEIAFEQFTDLNNLLEEIYVNKFSSDPGVFTIDQNTIDQGEQFIAKKSLHSVSIGDTYVVKNISPANVVTVENVATGVRETLGRESFQEYFVPKSKLNNVMTTQKKDLDQDSKQNRNESITTASEFLSDSAKLAELRKDVDGKSAEELDTYSEELKNNLKNLLNC